MIQPQQLASANSGRSSQKPIPKLTPANTDEHRITPGFNISPPAATRTYAPFHEGGRHRGQKSRSKPIQPNPTSKIHQNFAAWRLLRLCAKLGTAVPENQRAPCYMVSLIPPESRPRIASSRTPRTVESRNRRGPGPNQVSSDRPNPVGARKRKAHAQASPLKVFEKSERQQRSNPRV